MTSIRPVAAAERLPLVDVLRGVAISGVLVAYTFWSLGAPPASTWRAGERILDTGMDLLVDAKFVTIFAFLFGLGTSQQWRRIAAHGRDVRGIHLRRMTFLLAAGLVHALLLRNGDILAPYAILGFVLLAARGRSNRQLAAAAVVLALLPYAIQVAMYAAHWQFGPRPDGGGDADWSAYWRDNLAWLRYWYVTNPLLAFPRILAVMLVGVLADRARLIARIAVERRLALRALVITLPLAIVFRGTFAMLPARWAPEHAPFVRGIVLNQIYYLAAWSLAASYVAAFALLCQRPAWPERLSWLRAVGRMAFTNYVLQAGLVVPACLAFGLFDHVRPFTALALALGVLAIEIPFSVWWLKANEYGPIEWLWRRFSYGAIAGARVGIGGIGAGRSPV